MRVSRQLAGKNVRDIGRSAQRHVRRRPGRLDVLKRCAHCPTHRRSIAVPSSRRAASCLPCPTTQAGATRACPPTSPLRAPSGAWLSLFNERCAICASSSSSCCYSPPAATHHRLRRGEWCAWWCASGRKDGDECGQAQRRLPGWGWAGLGGGRACVCASIDRPGCLAGCLAGSDAGFAYTGGGVAQVCE